LLIDLSNPGSAKGLFTSASIAQIILYLDRDYVSGQVNSDGAYVVGPG